MLTNIDLDIAVYLYQSHVAKALDKTWNTSVEVQRQFLKMNTESAQYFTDLNVEAHVKGTANLTNTYNFFKAHTCFKTSNWKSIALMLTNKKYLFIKNQSFPTGFRDHHHFIYTILKSVAKLEGMLVMRCITKVLQRYGFSLCYFIFKMLTILFHMDLDKILPHYTATLQHTRLRRSLVWCNVAV